MTLKVIGAGYPRTGTASLKLALEQLGFGPCHHMREVFMNPQSASLWVAAAEGKPDWDTIFANYQSTTDAPACNFWRELATYYPNAKVLLSVRDPEKWFESTQATVLSPQMTGMQDGSPLKEFFDKAVWRHLGARANDRDFMIALFNRHIEEVKRQIPKERLLVFDAREGWAPLCKFLGVPVPETPFPQTNSREEMLAIRATASDTFDPGKPLDLEAVAKFARERFGKK